MTAIANIADMREAARRTLPRDIFNFIDGASFSESTLRANCEDFGRLHFRQRVMRDVTERSLATEILGQPSSMPLAISPTGLSGLLRGGRGEILAARAARAAGIPYILGMMSICSLEEVAAEAGPIWFQLAMLKDRGLVKSLIERAIEAGCPTLMVTLTWPVSGHNLRLVRTGASALPPKLNLESALQYARRPGWVMRTLLGKPIRLHNFERYAADGPMDVGRIVGLLETAPSWKDIEWVRSLWPRKLILKGVCDKDDVGPAFAAGADAISVSNHGGNQLEGARSTITVLPEIVEAADGRGEVLLDGGVRNGQDVLKALALGAKACLIGRSHLYGLGAMGEAGVARALEILRTEMDVTLALSGVADVKNVSSDMLA